MPRKAADSSLGLRYNTDKPELSMIFEARPALEGLARALMHGKKKYKRGNWRKGLKHAEIVDSLGRHLTAYMSGEEIDPIDRDGSGLPHVDHILCNALFLSEMYYLRPDLDERPIKQGRVTEPAIEPIKRGRKMPDAVRRSLDAKKRKPK